MAFSYNKKNLANTTITGEITPTQTSVIVADATVFSYAFFYATLMPSNEMSNASNSEIVLVTNIQGNTLTLVRGQENTIARPFPSGAVITNGIYTRDIDYARSIGRKVFMAQDDGTDATNTSYQITDPMIKNVPEEGSIITVEFDTPSYGAPTLGVNNGIGGLMQVSGSNIHITDSSGQIDSVEMYGDTEQTTYSGKNLAPIIVVPGGSYGIEATYNATTGLVGLTGTGTATWANPFATTSPASIPAGTYTFSISKATNLQINLRMRINNANADYKILPGQTSVTFTTTGAATNCYVWLSETNGTIVDWSGHLQLEAGSSTTSFEPYVGGTASPTPDSPQTVQTVTGRQVVTISDGGSESQEYEINLGKNLCDGINQEYWLTSTATDAGVSSSNSGLIIPIEQNTSYTISTTSSQARYRVAFSDQTYQGSQFNCYNGANRDGTSDSITRNSGNHKYLIVNATDLTKIQIEKGSTASSFAPYFTPIELCKIGTYQDYIYKNGEDWYLHKEIDKIDMSTISDWSKNGNVGFYKLGFSSDYNMGQLYSNIFTYSETVWATGGKIGVTSSGNLWITFNEVASTSAGDVPAWLANKNAILYATLVTPTDTQITNSALIAQLNALYNMLPEGVADIVVTGDLPGLLTIKYYQQGTGTYVAPIVGGAEIDGGDNEQVVGLDSYIPYRLVYDTNGYWRVLNKGPKVTTGAIADSAVTSDKIDWTTFDTGWLDCPYASGYTTPSNAEWTKLQARICGKILYLRGGVSPTNNGQFTDGTEVKVASLPSSIKTIFTAKAAGCHYQSCGRCALSGASLWTILGANVSIGSTGDITVITVHMSESTTYWPKWASVGLFAMPLY